MSLLFDLNFIFPFLNLKSKCVIRTVVLRDSLTCPGTSSPCLPDIGLLPGEEPWKTPSWRLVLLLGWIFYSSVKCKTLPFRKNSCTMLIEHLRSCGLQDSVSPVELSSARQPFSAPSAALHTRGVNLLASQSDPGRPWFLLPVTCSAAQATEPARIRRKINFVRQYISHHRCPQIYSLALLPCQCTLPICHWGQPSLAFRLCGCWEILGSRPQLHSDLLVFLRQVQHILGLLYSNWK